MENIVTRIPVVNGGFENPVLENNGFTIRDVPGWQPYDPLGFLNTPPGEVVNYAVLNPATFSYPAEAPQGQNVGALFVAIPPKRGIFGISQTLSDVLTPNTTYRLQVRVGNPNPDEFFGPGFPGYAVQLLAGGNVIAQDFNTVNPAEGTFATSTVTYTPRPNDPNLGQPLGIRLIHALESSGTELGFDDVRLEATRPAVINAGFEALTVEKGSVAPNDAPGWELYDPSGLVDGRDDSSFATFNPLPISYPGGVPEGNNGLGIYITKPPGSGQVVLSQKLQQVLTPDTTYTLNVDVGNIAPSPGFEGIAGYPGYAVQLLAGGNVIAQDFDTLRPPDGTWTTSTVRYTASANDPNLGRQLEIRLLNPLLRGGQDSNFDNVRLNAVKVPPGLFNEAYYLRNYTDVAVAVGAGRFASGLEHFNLVGRNEGRTSISPYFDEASYLQKYSDVAAGVRAGSLSSGLEHFIEFGYNEGRAPDVGISSAGEVYLRKYADVAAAVNNGSFNSWYDHFIQFGLAEGRSPDYFNVRDYLIYHPDVSDAVANGSIRSVFDHLVRFGQFENRAPVFSGSGGNDTIQGFGIGRALFGVDFDVIRVGDYRLRSTGVGEVDTLIGTPGREGFILGSGISPSNPNATQFYVGRGADDYAMIRNFERGIDVIELAGSASSFTQQVSEGNLRIFANGDLVGVVEGVTNPLTITSGNDFFPYPGTFFLS